MPRISSVCRAACVLVYPALLARMGTAHGQPSSEEKAVAEGLFQEGRKAMASGQIADACAKFSESYRIAQRLGTLLNLATCHEAEGKTASAWAEFVEAAALSRRSDQADRALY